ncbi:Uncharacterised protein [Escherichia coli]|nr:Uncharacterised protein [Escherichia coli]
MRLPEKSRPLGRLFYLHHQTANVRQRVVNDGNENGHHQHRSITRWSKEREIAASDAARTLYHSTGSIADLENAEDSTSGAFTIGAKWVVPGADAGDVKQPPAFRPQSATVTRFLRNSHQLARQLDDAFLVDVLNTGTTRPFGVSTATPMLMYSSGSDADRLPTTNC